MVSCVLDVRLEIYATNPSQKTPNNLNATIHKNIYVKDKRRKSMNCHKYIFPRHPPRLHPNIA